MTSVQDAAYDPQARWHGDDLKNAKSMLGNVRGFIAILVWVFVVMTLISLPLGPLQAFALLQQMTAAEGANPELVEVVGAYEAYLGMAGLANLWSMLVSMVLLLTAATTAVWTGYAYHYFTLKGIRMSRPVWMAAVWFLIPVANLIVPFTQFLEIRKVSGADRLMHARMVFVWWMLAVGGPILLIVGQQIAVGIAVSGEPTEAVGNLVVVTTIAQCLTGVLMVGGAACLRHFINSCTQAVMTQEPVQQDSPETD